MSLTAVRLRAGDLRTRVTILQPMVQSGVRTWAVVKTVWAEVDARVSSDRTVGLQPPDVLNIHVNMRYQPDLQIRPRMRLSLKGGRTLEIISTPNILERNRVLRLVAREVTS